jgi:hypothetical protein
VFDERTEFKPKSLIETVESRKNCHDEILIVSAGSDFAGS